MITVQRLRGGFHIEGHANYADHGKDIVCAGVSALAQSVFLTCEAYGFNMVSDVKSGEMHMYLKGDRIRGQVALAILDVFYLGVSAMAKEYPNYITYKEE